MRVEVFTAVSAFQDLRAEWRQLLAQVPFQSVFFTPEWQETWWRHFGATRQLHLLTVRSSDGTLQGLVPLMSSPGIEGTARLELLGDLELCDYLDVLMAPARQHEVGHAVVEYLIGNGGEEVEVCLQNLSQHSATSAVFQDCLLHSGLTVEVEQIETCPTVLLPSEWEAYLALLRGKDRHELRRKLRRAAAAARLEYRVTSAAAQLDEDINTFVALHRMSQQDAKQGFMTPEKEAFFRAMARQLWPQGWLELAFLYADGEPIATLCCFAYGSTYAAYNSGYHPAYGDLSAGIVLFAERIRTAIARGFTAFDFMRGDEPYKYRFGATDRPLYQLLARTACPVQGSCL
ncbi:MAG TPA: GNAT family N-acetyltransferase [Candidatus Tectomicrobia bacterium]